MLFKLEYYKDYEFYNYRKIRNTSMIKYKSYFIMEHKLGREIEVSF